MKKTPESFVRRKRSDLQDAVSPCKAVLEGLRARDVFVVHTHEGDQSDLSDAPPAKLERCEPSKRIRRRRSPWVAC